VHRVTRFWRSVVDRFGRLAGRRPARVPEQRREAHDPLPAGRRQDDAAPTGRRQDGGAASVRARATSARAGGRSLGYAPALDGRADPGEIVWTWVEYEDEPGHGKDRPVLVVGRRGTVLLGLMLSSRHTRDGQPNWLALGPGDWDREARPSWVRLDRVLELAEDGIRREGAILDRARFDLVADALRHGYGWH
jgi:hypothetical protein